MYKLKTHSGAKKRFKLSKSGKVKFKRAKMRHIMLNKSTKVKRHLKHGSYLKEEDAKHVRSLLPND